MYDFHKEIITGSLGYNFRNLRKQKRLVIQSFSNSSRQQVVV